MKARHLNADIWTISGSSETLLPSGLVLPDPSSNAAGASVWDQTITLTSGAKASGGNNDDVVESTVADVTSVAAPASSTILMTSAAAKTSAAPVTSVYRITSAVPETSAAAETSEAPSSTDQLAVQTSSPLSPSPSSTINEASQTKAVVTSPKSVISDQLSYSATPSLTAVEPSSVSEVVDVLTTSSTTFHEVGSSGSPTSSESDSDQANFESSGQPVAVQTSSPAPQPISDTVQQLSSTQQETTVEAQISAQPETSAQPQTSGQPQTSAQPQTSDQPQTSGQFQSSAQPSESSYRSESNEQPTRADSSYASDPTSAYQASSSHPEDSTPTLIQSSDSASFSTTDGNDYSSDNGDYDNTSVIAVQTSASLKASPSVVQSENQRVTSYDASTYQVATASLSSSAYLTDTAYESSNDDNLSDSEEVPQTSPSQSLSAPTSASAAIVSNTYLISSNSSDSSDGGVTVTALDARPSSTAQASSSQTDVNEAGSSSSSASSFESKISPSGSDDNGSPSETDQSQSQYFEPSSSDVSTEQFTTPTSSHQPTTYAAFIMPASSSSASSDEPFVFTVGGMTIGQFTEAGADAMIAVQFSSTSTTDSPAAENSAWAETAAVENIEGTDATSTSASEVAAASAARTSSAFLADGNNGSWVSSVNESVSPGAPTSSEEARETSDSNRSGEDNYGTYSSASPSTEETSKDNNQRSGAGENTASATVDYITTSPTQSSSIVSASYIDQRWSASQAKATVAGESEGSKVSAAPTTFSILSNSTSSDDSFGRESSDDKRQSLSATSYQANFTITGESAMVSASGHSHHQSDTAVNDMISQIIAVETSVISFDSSPLSSVYRFSKGDDTYTKSGSPGAEPTSMSPWAQALSNNRNSSASISEIIVTASSLVSGASYSLESASTQKAVVTGGQSSGKTCARKRKEKARRARALLIEAV